MPTVHVSLPDSVYRELKRRAGELGIQVTDLIRIYIKEALEGACGRGSSSEEAFGELARRVDELERRVKAEIVRLRGKQRELEELFQYVLERMEMIEDMIEARARGGAAVVGESEG
ncbi:hypothetical protein [Stetteria hydrogenophila]